MTTQPTGAAELPEAQRFTKKPVTIEAIQWTGKNLRQVITFTDGPPDTRSMHASMMWDDFERLVERDGLKIFTLEGKMLANVGDWIIRGVKGEYYPCKPDIFAATYEPAAQVAALTAQASAAERAAELERMRQRISRIGLDIDRAMRGDVNTESPVGTGRLQAIANAAQASAAERAVPALSTEDAGMLDQACEMLETYASELKRSGADSASQGAECSAYVVRKLASAMLAAAPAQPDPAPARLSPEAARAMVDAADMNDRVLAAIDAQETNLDAPVPAQPGQEGERDYPPLPKVGPIGYASVVDVDRYAKTLEIGPHLPGVRDVALWTSDQMRAYVDADRAARAAAPAAVPGVSWDGKLSDRLQNSLDALRLECSPAIVKDIEHEVRQECEALYTSLNTTKRMYAAARDRLDAMEAARPQTDPFAAPQPTAPAATVDADPLQGAANWLNDALVNCNVRDIQHHLFIGYNRAKRLHDAALAANREVKP